MLHSLRCFILKVFYQINFGVVRLQEGLGNGLDPLRDSGREHEALQVLKSRTLNCVDNKGDILFETKVEHLISLVENGIFEDREIEIFALDMVNDTPTSADENVNAASELVRLIMDVAATIDSENVVLMFVVLQSC